MLPSYSTSSLPPTLHSKPHWRCCARTASACVQSPCPVLRQPWRPPQTWQPSLLAADRAGPRRSARKDSDNCQSCRRTCRLCRHPSPTLQRTHTRSTARRSLRTTRAGPLTSPRRLSPKPLSTAALPTPATL